MRKCVPDLIAGKTIGMMSIAEDALGYKIADRHHGTTGLRDIRKTDIAAELAKA